MQIILLVLGKTTEKWISSGIEIYQNRLKHYTNFKIEELPEIRAGGKSAEVVLGLEATQVKKYLQPGDKLVLLDEHGEHHTSRGFADVLQKWMNASPRRLVFVVGGAFGFDDEVKQLAQHKLSLGNLTFTHQMIRVFFVEQLYRAFTILKGEGYHND